MDPETIHGTEAGWAEEWVAALDELELSLDQAERLLKGEAPEALPLVTPWSPPSLEGPMPVDLRTRALALHYRQQQLLHATAEAAVAMRRQSELTSRMSTARTTPAAVYLDVTA